MNVEREWEKDMGRWPKMGRQVASRRAVLASMAGVVAAGAIAGCDSKHPSARGAAVTSEPPKPVSLLPVDHRSSFDTPGRPLAMAIVAHPDDDLFFMNPDTLHTIERGVPVVSVYVTGGGSFGVNQAPGEPKARPDVPAYVSARQQGLRQAYARMLGATLFTPWTRTALKLPGGREAELNVLEYNGRRAELIFLGVRMHEKTGRGWVGMTQLWNTPGVVLRTQPTPESPVREKYTYSRDELTDALLFLMRKYRPTLVRTLDPDPDAQVHDKLHPRGSDQVGYSDHPDHTAVALFTWRALAQWGQGTPRARAPRASSPRRSAATTTSAGPTTCPTTPSTRRPSTSTPTAAPPAGSAATPPAAATTRSASTASSSPRRAGSAPPTAATRRPARRSSSTRTAG